MELWSLPGVFSRLVLLSVPYWFRRRGRLVTRLGQKGRQNPANFPRARQSAKVEERTCTCGIVGYTIRPPASCHIRASGTKTKAVQYSRPPHQQVAKGTLPSLPRHESHSTCRLLSTAHTSRNNAIGYFLRPHRPDGGSGSILRANI